MLEDEIAGLANGLEIELVAVDEKFVEKYLDVTLAEMRAGDLVFAALAKGDSLPLITEDRPLRSAAESSGIQVYSTNEYLMEIQRVAI
jgi:rRNA-processing protein FCF1